MKRKGFTLIELLVVIAIIGLLSTLAVVSLNTAKSKARDAKRMSDLRSIQTAIEMYKSDNSGAVPSSSQSWASFGTIIASYLPSVPTTTGDATYALKYCTSTVSGAYYLASTLENNPSAPGASTAPATSGNPCINSSSGSGSAAATCNATTGFCLTGQ